MPTPTTAGTIIRNALILNKAVGADQTVTASEENDCLSMLNDFLEELSTETQGVYASLNQTFSTVAGQSTYTIGSGGNWNTVRPVRINDPVICTYQGIDFPVWSWDQETYNLVGLKTQQQPIVQQYVYVNSYPLGNVILWPVPSEVVSITMTIDTILTQISSAAASYSMPPGYVTMLTNNLSVITAPMFGKEAPMPVQRKAMETLAKIKRANKRSPVSRMDGALVDPGPVIWQRGY